MKNILLKCSFVLLLLSNFNYSQAILEPLLVEEFGKIGCEDVLARTDAFFTELQNKPKSQGYVIVNIDHKTLERGFKYEQWIKGNIKFRGFDETRIKFIRSISDSGIKVTFWSVSKDAKLPDFVENKWDFTFPPNKKPFIFSSTYDVAVCPAPEAMDINIYAEYLTANPKARGNIVIRTPLAKKFKVEKLKLIKLISGKYKISGKRLRFFHIKEQYQDPMLPKDFVSDYPEVEIWLLP